MNDKKYNRMLLRRRFCKRVIFMLFVFGISFYGSVLVFGDLNSPRVQRLTDLDRCPACYGVSVCPELYSNQIMLESDYRLTSIFNAKNIYYGFTKLRKVVLKKLSHSWELKEFDSKLCQTWGLKRNCKPVDLLSVKNPDEKIVKLVEYNLSNPETQPRKGLVYCPYAATIHALLKPFFENQGTNNYRSDVINIWTMLSINPEPIIIQIIPKSKGWPVPAFGGVCGRLELVAYEGEPLSSLMHLEWHRKLKFAAKILAAAMDFTFRHDRFRFYLMDWSIDNIVVNEKDDITFIDLEDVVVLDKHISPQHDLPNWYQRYSRENIGQGFSFSIDKMCKHHLSDHNLWAACYVLAGEENPLLHPIPKEVNTSRPHFNILLNECLNGQDRFLAMSKLQQVISDMLADEKVMGFGTAFS